MFTLWTQSTGARAACCAPLWGSSEHRLTVDGKFLGYCFRTTLGLWGANGPVTYTIARKNS